MSLTVTQRPTLPNTTLNVINGSITGSIAPWVNFGLGTGWTYNSNDARCVITSGDSKIFRQPFNAVSGETYNYSFDRNVSSVGGFSIVMRFRSNDGSSTQTIRQASLSDGSATVDGSVVANANYSWVEIQILENTP